MPTIKNYQDKQVYINKAREAEKKYGIPENTLVGLLAQESGHFDPRVISGEKKSYAGAIGIGQFMSSTAKEYKIDPLNVDQAIDASAKYLSSSFREFGNWDDAILSYNAGVGRVKEYKSGKPIKIKEHAEYVGRVKNQINRYGGTNINSEVSNFDIPQTNTIFAGVPDVYREEDPKKAVEELQQKEAENKFLEQYRQIQQPIEQEQEEPTLQAPPTDVIGIASQVSQFVDTPLFQQGGEFTENELAFLSEIAVKDNSGYWNKDNKGKVVEIDSPSITMKNVEQPLIGVSKQTGEKKTMLPNIDYFFQNTKQVIEIPVKK